jgi:nicotinamidase-related amidase
MTVNLENSVLVVVDMQNGFIHPNSAHIVPTVVDLVSRWHHAGGDTVFSRFINNPGSPYERLLQWQQLRTSPQIDIIDELALYADRATAVVDKPAYTLFTTEGTKAIAAGGWSNVIICGLATESCVCKTAVDAFEHDLVPWVVTDACATHAGSEAHDAGLLVIRRFIGPAQLITTRELNLSHGCLDFTERQMDVVHNITG